MTNYFEMVPRQEDFEYLMNWLESQDVIAAMGTCDDHLVDGYCRMCTIMQRLQAFIKLMNAEDAWIGTK